MRRTKEEAMRTRMSIMESALDIFSEKNFANASVSEITARIGLSKGAFYWHFKNKQDILIKIIEEFCAGDCDKYMGLCEASPEAVGSLRGYVKEVLERLRSEERWKKLTYIVTRQKAGRIRKSLSAHKAAVLLVSIFHGFGISQLAGALPEELPESLEHSVRRAHERVLGEERSVKAAIPARTREYR